MRNYFRFICETSVMLFLINIQNTEFYNATLFYAFMRIFNLNIHLDRIVYIVIS